ncbi:MAG: 2Fe-2S iron-sulfur cluster-binding protein, partial [Bythopirellula sp.]
MIAPAQHDKPSSFEVRVLRQDAPGGPSRWERHQVTYEPNLNVISVLQKIATQATTSDGKSTTPVAWDCNCLEEVCGACTMLVNGKTRQACSAIVDRLLEENPGEIELRPMSKFPVMRDLVVNRRRVFHALKHVQAWNPVDDYTNRGAGPKQTQKSQESAYPLSECMS